MLVQAIRRAAQTRPNGAAFLGTTAYAWPHFTERVRRFAGMLVKRGIGRGDRVAILAHNSSDYLEAQFAIWWMGGVVVPLNTRWSVEENDCALCDCSAHLLIADDAHIVSARQLAGRVAKLGLIHIDGAQSGATSSHEALLDGSVAADPVETAHDALAAIYYTGGTTGAPKGVMLSPLALWSSAMAMALDLGLTERVRYLHAAPMFHLANGSLSLATTLVGGTHVFVPGFAPAPVLDAIERHRVTHTLLVPTMVRMLIDAPDVASRDLSSLALLTYGAAPMPEALLREAQAILPACRFAQAYGQTELGPVATICGPQHQTPGAGKFLSVGRAGFCVELKIVDEAGAELPRGTPGEIWARGPNVMLGYWNKPAETAAALRNGWLRTGDVGTMDADGFVMLCDRVKDMIISGGENIFSVEVENAVCSHPDVAAAAVVGLPDPFMVSGCTQSSSPAPVWRRRLTI